LVGVYATSRKNHGDNLSIYLFTKKFNEYIPYEPGDYCEGAIPDPIPNSEVKSFSADGTLFKFS